MIRRFLYSFYVLTLVVLVGCAKQKKEKPPQELGAKELVSRLNEATVVGRKSEAISWLENLLERFPEHKDTIRHQRKLADLYFDKKNYQKADEFYKRLKKTTPVDSDYLAYRAILCKFYQTLSPDRDATMINKTVKRAKKYLSGEGFSSSKYAKDVKDIQYTCERKLIDREVYVYHSYVKQGKYKSAQGRLSYIRENFMDRHMDIEPRILYLESKLALYQDEKDVAVQKQRLLASKYPDSQYAGMAERLVSRSDFAFFA